VPLTVENKLAQSNSSMSIFFKVCVLLIYMHIYIYTVLYIYIYTHIYIHINKIDRLYEQVKCLTKMRKKSPSLLNGVLNSIFSMCVVHFPSQRG